MNQRSDLDRTLEIWMTDGPTTISDRLVDVVSGRIGRTRQRRSWRLPWRLQMNTPIKLITALAAVLVFAVVGYNLLPDTSGPGGPTIAPTPTAAPTSTPVATEPIVLPEGALAGGRYILQPLDDPSTLRIVADVPGGWQGVASWALLSSTEADGILIGFMDADSLFSDPCHWDLNGTGLEQPGDVVVGPTVDDLVTALKANTSYTSTAARPVAFGQFEGQQLELQLPGDDVLSTCDTHGEGSEFTGTAYYVFAPGFYAQGPNNRWHLYIVDVDGTRLITMVSTFEDTPPADIAAAEAIVESFEITP